MDVSKIEGIISAIEAESKAPSPSHNNLARLCAMFMREAIEPTDIHPEDPTPLYDPKAMEERAKESVGDFKEATEFVTEAMAHQIKKTRKPKGK